jgi:hypothetical protein
VTTLTIDDRIAQAETALSEGRIIQNDWRRSAEDGRELVCALAAFGPDINSSSDCPADLMPQWLAELVPVLDDGLAAADVPWFMGELVRGAKCWRILDEAAWDRIRTGFSIGLVRQAIASAKPALGETPPAYWTDVESACDRVIAALEAGDVNQLEEARAAAWAAARAAEAAARAAEAAARAAARAAAWAARAAARAAEAAARAAARAAAWAARAAARAATRQSCELLFKLINVELEAVVG